MNQGGGIKLPAQIKSITGGLNKLQRDSMGDTGSGNPGDGQQMMHGSMMQQTPNFYEQPQNYGKQERGGSDIGHGNNYDNTNANLMNRFSPKVSLGQDMNNVFSGSQGHGHVS